MKSPAKKFLDAETRASLTENGKYAIVHIVETDKTGKYNRAYDPATSPPGRNATHSFYNKYINVLYDPEQVFVHETLMECELLGEPRIMPNSRPSSTGFYSNESPEIMNLVAGQSYKVKLGTPRNRASAKLDDLPWLEIKPITDEDIERALERRRIMSSLLVF